jgi:hypothetical protein
MANFYRLIDDTGTSAGPPGGMTGGGSGQPVMADFTATSLANAGQIAYIISSVLQLEGRAERHPDGWGDNLVRLSWGRPFDAELNTVLGPECIPMLRAALALLEAGLSEVIP